MKQLLQSWFNINHQSHCRISGPTVSQVTVVGEVGKRMIRLQTGDNKPLWLQMICLHHGKLLFYFSVAQIWIHGWPATMWSVDWIPQGGSAGGQEVLLQGVNRSSSRSAGTAAEAPEGFCSVGSGGRRQSPPSWPSAGSPPKPPAAPQKKRTEAAHQHCPLHQWRPTGGVSGTSSLSQIMELSVLQNLYPTFPLKIAIFYPIQIAPPPTFGSSPTNRHIALSWIQVRTGSFPWALTVCRKAGVAAGGTLLLNDRACKGQSKNSLPQ